MKSLKFITLSLGLLAVTAFGAIYKWTDEEGNTYYSDSAKGHDKAREIKISPTPKSSDDQAGELKTPPTPPHKQQPVGKSLPLEALGPLPENNSSKFLETKSTGITFNLQKRTARFTILLNARRGLPFGAYLEAYFDNPEEPNAPLIAGKARQGGQQEIFIMSPEFKGLKCWNYQVVVYVYRGRSKSHQLSIHRQSIQSRINLEKIKSLKDLLESGQRGKCP